MPKIRESNYSKIENKIITLDDVFKLSSLVHKEYLSAKNNNKHSSISYMAKCSDDSSFESEDVSIFAKDSFLLYKKVKSIDIDYHLYETNSYISICIMHGENYFNGSSFTVKGTDSTWVNGITKKIENTVDSFKPQNKFSQERYMSILLIVLGLSFSALFLSIIELLTPIESPKGHYFPLVLAIRDIFEQIPLLKTIFKHIVFLPMGLIPAFFLIHKLQKLWPSIEVQIGPEHTQLEKKRRNRLIGIFTLVILPLLLSQIK